jgi:hypothetical protein
MNDHYDVRTLEQRVHPTQLLEVSAEKTTRDTVPYRIFSSLSEEEIKAFCKIPEEDQMTPLVQKSPADSGFLMIKIEKCASTTSASVHTRIAHRLFRGNPICKHRSTHLWSSRLLWTGCHSFACIQHNQTFLWTMLREPSRRVISEFFHMSKDNLNPTPENMIHHLRASLDYYFRKLDGRKTAGPKRTVIITGENVQSLVLSTLHRMNFIGVVERMDDSICLLGLLLKLDPSDLVYFSTKVQGQYLQSMDGHNCYKVPKSFVPPVVQSFFESEEWKNQSIFSSQLYAAANKSIDATIDSIGRNTFLAYRQEFDRLQQIAHVSCSDEVKLPCNHSGVLQLNESYKSCYMGDIGCGYRCLDRIFSNRSMRWYDINRTS